MLAFAQAPANAQQPAKAPQIGYLNSPLRHSASLPLDWSRRGLIEPFRQGLRELGYVEGQNVILQTRIADEWQLHDLAVELVQLKVDVIVAQGASPIRAAMKATNTIPIVMTFPGDAASEGFVASLVRPGGNVTGVSGLTPELGGKWLELLKETIPSARRVAVLWNPRSEDIFPTWKGVDHSARSLGVDLQWLEVRNRNHVASAFRLATLGRADAFIVLPGGIFFTTMSEIVDLAQKSRLPGISWRGDFAEVGGLMAYGANRLEQSRRAAYVVDKILKGAKPADLPVELPKSFELVINLKTAKEIGITVPPRVLIWADRVIK
jgi:putative ABC transport system substrate-binding protein